MPIVPVFPDNPAVSELLLSASTNAKLAALSQSAHARPSVPYTIRAPIVPVPGMATMTESPVLWCGEDEDNGELTLADLEAGSGSDEIPPELRGAAREEWRKNHPDEQLSEDDRFDSYELENTRIEVLL